MLEALTKLVRHMEWADARVVASLRAADPPPDALRLFNHIVGAERLWYLRLQQEDWTTQPVWPSLTLEACASLAELNAKTYREYLDNMEEPDLARAITYTNSKGQEYTNTVADILLHMTTHGSYHRGQIARILRRAGQEPPSTDYILFVR